MDIFPDANQKAFGPTHSSSCFPLRSMTASRCARTTRALALLWLSWLLQTPLTAAADVDADVSTFFDAYHVLALSTQSCSLPSGCTDDKHLENDDAVYSLTIAYPSEGSVVKLPVEIRCRVNVRSIEAYQTYYDNKLICIELNGERTKCSPLVEGSGMFDDLERRDYTARAFIIDRSGTRRVHQTAPTSFTVVSAHKYDVYSRFLAEQSRQSQQLPKDENLFEWASQLQYQNNMTDPAMASTYASNSSDENPVLVIGIKSAVAVNFPQRQAIRETWASREALPSDVKVMFLGGTPYLTDIQSPSERQRIMSAIRLEKQKYGDLLTDELGCEDSYNSLTDKVKAFLRFAAERYPSAPFIMVADDDIYLRADQLAELLRKEEHPKRLYIGQVWDDLLAHSLTPVRDPQHRYYLPEQMYPLSSFPPFAYGPHYLMSVDCAHFIVKNDRWLRGLGGMDDVSVAFWLLTIQVHVKHTPSFTTFRIQACDDRATSFADLSTLAIRSIHANLLNGRKFCHGANWATWKKRFFPPLAVSQRVPTQLQIKIHVHDIAAIGALKVTAVISTLNRESIEMSYFPSIELFNSFSRGVCVEAQRHFPDAARGDSGCDVVSNELFQQIKKTLRTIEASNIIESSRLELWKYNIFIANQDSPPVIIGYSQNSVYSVTMMECIFAEVFEAQKRPILVVSEPILHQHYGGTPDVFVFSALDIRVETEPLEAAFQELVSNFKKRYLGSDSGEEKDGKSVRTRLVMISGEAWSTEGLDEDVLLLSTVSVVGREKFVHLPVASLSFAERLDHTPMALLSPSVDTSEQSKEPRRFCAHLYARCDRPQREYMFDVLNALEPVDALGVCAGLSRPPDTSYQHSRYSMWYNDDAVRKFKRYKFVIAFENSPAPGYVTEKLVNAFLAGSVPIYLGNTTTVSQLFNPDSFIDCGRFQTLRECAAFAIKVHKSPEMYARLRREPPIGNRTAFSEVFSWHPSVPSHKLVSEIARLL